MTSIISLGKFEEREEMNLRVIRRVFSKLVKSIHGNYGECSVYEFNFGKWDKLQVTGCLFIIEMYGNSNPFLYVLNRCSYIEPEDFHQEIGINSQIAIEGSQVFLAIEAEEKNSKMDEKNDIKFKKINPNKIVKSGTKIDMAIERPRKEKIQENLSVQEELPIDMRQKVINKRDICLSFSSEKKAEEFTIKLREFWRGNGSNSSSTRDPTFKHAWRYIESSRI